LADSAAAFEKVLHVHELIRGLQDALAAKTEALTASALGEEAVPIDSVLHRQALAVLATALARWAAQDSPGEDDLAALVAAGRSVCSAFSDLGDALEMIGVLARRLTASGPGADPGAMGRVFHGVSLASAEGARAHIELKLLDPLTRLPRLAAFERDLAEAITAADVSSDELTVVFVDLDGLKQINDSEGHTSGDQAIYALADSLRSAAGHYKARIYHLHGDEFSLILREDPHAARLLLRRVRKAAWRSDSKGANVRVAFSAGFAIYPDDGRLVRELKDTADDRMQEDKRRRRAGR
jgi:diguanylate cyclase (GGDEF)-like protein